MNFCNISSQTTMFLSSSFDSFTMVLTKITLILMIVKAIYCENNFNLDKLNEDVITKKAACIKSVIRKEFSCGTLMTLVDSTEVRYLIQILNSENDCYSFIIRTYDDHDWYIPTPVYLIGAENVTEFSTGILTITNDLFWNPRGRFIIDIEALAEGDVEKVFKILMKHKAFDAILIRNVNNDVIIDTYYPFKDNNCGEKIEVATIGTCNAVAHLNCFRNKEITLRNCTVKIAATQNIPNFIFESSEYTENGKPLLGLEQFLLETIAEQEGIKLHYTLVGKGEIFGVVLTNHTATGLLSIMQNFEVDIGAGGCILMKNRVLLFDFMWGYNYAAFQVYTPAIGEEIWKDVYREFSVETWILIVIAYCLVIVISTMKRRLLLRRSQNQLGISLKLWGYFYLNTSSRLSKEKGFRVIMVFWIWFTFFVSSFYHTELYSLLTRRDEITGHISTERLRELPYEPCISLTTRTYFLYAYNQKLPKERDIPECEFPESALDYVAIEKNAYGIEIEYIFALNEYKYIDKDGKSMLDTWSFSFNNVIAMYLTRGFPLRDKFQEYAMKMYESGIMQKHLYKINRIKNRYSQASHKVHFEKMWLADLRIHFYIILFGFVLSTVCFVLEILWHRYSKILLK